MSCFLMTERIRLRQWQPADLPSLTALCTNDRVMEFFPTLLNEAEINAFFQRHQQMITIRGFGFWLAERRDNNAFIGFIGLSEPKFSAHFTPCVEIGWRLMPHAWDQGFATEGAKACLQYGFERLGLPEIVSLTARINVRSEAVMKRLGMHRDSSDDFDHPLVTAGHRLRPHILYRKAAPL